MKAVRKLQRIHIACGVLLLAAGIYAVKQGAYDDLLLDQMTGRYANAQSAFVDVDGMQVHYRDTGAGAPAPLLLLHGNSSSLHTWDAWAAHFEGTRRVVRLDLPGFGLTGPDPEKRYGFKSLTGFLARFCDKLGLPQADVAGNSHGGRLAWAFAAQYPERVHKLILLDAAGYPLSHLSTWLARIRGSLPVLFLANYLTPRFVVGIAIRGTYGDKSKVTDAMIDHYHGLQLRAGNRAAMGEMMTIYGVDDRKMIRDVKAPTLLQWGSADRVFSTGDAERFHQDIPGSKLLIYEGVGHLPMEEAPEATARDAQAFLDER